MGSVSSQCRHHGIGNAGFTLLEIIAVLVILSILAVVAVPRYFDLQEQARTRAMETAMAEAISRVNGYFAQQLLSGFLPRDIEYNNDTIGSDLGDFTLEVQDNTPEGFITLTVFPKLDEDGSEVAAALRGASLPPREIPRPGFDSMPQTGG